MICKAVDAGCARARTERPRAVRKLNLSRCLRGLGAVVALCLLLSTWATASGAQLLGEDASQVFKVTNGSIESVVVDGEPTLRWSIQEGQTSQLELREDHPIWSQLREFDRLQLQFRIARGEINSFGLTMLGHVPGPRQYKVHEWNLAVRTTDRQRWHARDIDLMTPNWFPWDNKDGYGTRRFMRFEAMGLEPGTVIELRGVQLLPARLYVKPDYEAPYTWPVWKDGAYRMPVQVLNVSGVPTTISARVLSQHEHFQVTIEPETVAVRAGEVASFTVVAAISDESRAKTPELYAEQLQLAFATQEEPELPAYWVGNLVRPLSDGIKKQVIIPDEVLSEIRHRLADGDEFLRKALNLDRSIKTADAFCEIRLDQIPRNHSHVRNGLPNVPGVTPPRRLQPGTFMPEIVDAETGFREVGTSLAGSFWKEYLPMVVDHVGLAYLMTGDEKYAQKGVELMALYARQYGELNWYSMFDVPWFRGAPNNASSRVASNSSYGTNMLLRNFSRMVSMISESPSWTDEQRETAYRGFVLPYATELMKFAGGISNMTDITNHNLLLLGIVFNDAGLVHFATMSDPGLIRRLSDIDADGFSSEGRPLNYHFAAMTEYVPSIVYLKQSGINIDIPVDRLLQAVRMAYRRANLTGYVPITGDNARGWKVGPNAIVDYLLSLFPDQDQLLLITRGLTPASVLRRASLEQPLSPTAWRELLETQPRLFRHAGMAILRHGETADEQVMVTLDYGRNVFHAANDRNQITLSAFGRIFSHGPGSLYNVGSGGMTRNHNPQLERFASHASLGHNLVLVDQQNQQQAVGQLLAWSDQPAYQVAVSEVDGAWPGVRHIRGVVLAQGDVVIVLDQLESQTERTFDFAYHNLGELTPGQGWGASAAAEPLGDTANYSDIVDLQQLAGKGNLRLTWDLSQQLSPAELKKLSEQQQSPPPVGLDFRQLPVEGGQVFIGVTGMNNPNTAIMPDAAPSVFHRVRARSVHFVTVLHPYRGESRVRAIAPVGVDGVRVELQDGQSVQASLSQLMSEFAASQD